jgi:hypothetical protein
MDLGIILFPVVSELFIHAKAQRRKEEVTLNHSGANGFDMRQKNMIHTLQPFPGK